MADYHCLATTFLLDTLKLLFSQSDREPQEPQSKKTCAWDGDRCPSHAQALKWVNHMQPRLWETSTGSQQHSSWTIADCTPAEADSNNMLVVQSQSPGLSYLLPKIDKQTMAFMEAIVYFECELQPGLSATHWQTTYNVTPRDWLGIPQMLQNGVIVACLATRVVREGRNSTEMYNYRGRVISELRQYMNEPSQQTLATSLRFLLIIQQQEVLVSPIDGFVVHLDTASRFIIACGGVSRYLDAWLGALEMVTAFMLIDVISSTTTSVAKLPKYRVTAQNDCLQSVTDFEARLLDSTCPCPVSLFAIIIRINNLRLMHTTTSFVSAKTDRKTREILRASSAFDPGEWATNLPCLPQNQPQAMLKDITKQWASLALCYKLATIIYLIESTSNTNTNPKAIGLSTKAQIQLRNSMRFLFKSYPLRKATREWPVLWRFVTWPVMIYAYKTTVLDQGNLAESLLLENQIQPETLYDEICQIGVYDGSLCMVEGAKLLAEVAANDSKRSWDEVFSRSCVFYP